MPEYCNIFVRITLYMSGLTSGDFYHGLLGLLPIPGNVILAH